MILSVDPGKHIGIAWWKDDGTIVENKVIHGIDNFLSIFARLSDVPDLTAIIVEDYVLDHRAGRQGGSKLEASQVLGMLKMLAEQTGAQLVVQKNTDLRITAMHMGLKLGRGHIPDDVAAKLHGYRYFIEQGILKVRPGPVD